MVAKMVITERSLNRLSCDQSPLKQHSRMFHQSILDKVVWNHSCCKRNLSICALFFALIFSFWIRSKIIHNLNKQYGLNSLPFYIGSRSTGHCRHGCHRRHCFTCHRRKSLMRPLCCLFMYSSLPTSLRIYHLPFVVLRLTRWTCCLCIPPNFCQKAYKIVLLCVCVCVPFCILCGLRHMK
jgi:hypothetical protein